jgi:hypothetical protein
VTAWPAIVSVADCVVPAVFVASTHTTPEPVPLAPLAIIAQD